MAAPGRLCCKTRKWQGHEFFAKIRNGKRPLIRITSITLSKPPVSLTSGDEVPHIFTRKPRLQPAEFLIISAKRVLQHNRPRPVVRRGAAMRQLSEANPTFDVQADNIIAKVRCGRTALAKDLIKSFLVAWRASDRTHTDRRLR